MQTINIVTIIDVLGALSKGSLQNNIYMVDNSWNSENQGTSDLVTSCYPGQPINWIIHAMDVQTPVLIDSINFLDKDRQYSVSHGFDAKPVLGTAPHWYTWSGIVPCYLPAGEYRYSLKLQMGRGQNSIMYSDAPALNVNLL
ncbi:hypothetical protein IGB42_01190 [Andreprevotia sp. IGB-42]|uniref:hypothetical protein n=1 Tax=Andreprevotia sp. IGB-42 TaxID=2497473 RepID=UPI001356E832|nr:hypothetical protein [Andreprevotia sp. IGB-42]KAF0814289.1 hypothetical protein IGB42_01190 [Andreprevotia sp. IGB-42]